jgi:hypothetical protein
MPVAQHANDDRVDTAGGGPGQRSRPWPRLVRELRWHVMMALLAAVLLSCAVAFVIWVSLGSPSTRLGQPLTATDQLSLIRLALTVVAAVGGVVALVVAYRRQHVIEEENRRGQDTARREDAKLFTERFTASTGQLGHEKATVRLAGVYAVASLADDAPTWTLRQACIDVLCGYLRMPYEYDPQGEGWREGEREVRRTITLLITDHLHQTRKSAVPGWHGHRFDFEGAVFDGASFHFLHLPKETFLNFLHCHFVGGLNQFQQLNLTGGGVNLWETEVSGGELIFHGIHLEDGFLSFGNSRFSGGSIDFRSLDPEPEAPETDWTTTLSGGVADFQGVSFTGSDVRFDRIVVCGGELKFDGAKFMSGSVTLERARLIGGSVSLAEAAFGGADVRLENADIAPGVLDLRGIRALEHCRLPPSLSSSTQP